MLKEKTPPNIVSVKKSISLFKNVLAGNYYIDNILIKIK